MIFKYPHVQTWWANNSVTQAQERLLTKNLHYSYFTSDMG